MRTAKGIFSGRPVSGLLSLALSMAGQTSFAQMAPQPPTPPAMQIPAATPAPAANPNDTLKSFVVMPDGRVQFRLWAPNAIEVKLHAEGPEATPGITPQEANKNQGGVAMVKGDQGIWEAVIGPITPGTYRYTFTVDGVSTTDPRNPLTSQSLTHSSSLYDVPGADFADYRAGTPHGAISAVYYDSSATGGQRRMHVYTPPGYESGTARLPVTTTLS
jgi:enterochelin esterase family protein